MPEDEKLIHEIAALISEATGQTNLDILAVTGETKLTDAPFSLDSVDILEAVAIIEEKYKVHIVDAKEGALHFQSLQTIANFVKSKNNAT